MAACFHFGLNGSCLLACLRFCRFPQRAHSQQVTIGAMYVDKFPVTNAQYADYLKASKYVTRNSSCSRKNDRVGRVLGFDSGTNTRVEQRPSRSTIE